MFRFVIACCIAGLTSGCIILPGDHGEFRPPPVGATTVVDAATGATIPDANVVLVIRRAAAFIPDTMKPPDLAPKIVIDRFLRTDELRYRWREIYLFPWGAFGSCGYDLRGMYVYERGYLPAEYRASDRGQTIRLQPADPAAGKAELLRRASSNVEERYRDRMRNELDRRFS